tara:strand:- start:9270 stop:11342 length:2073 start_codon:yes stop_codon:yes gene_type:complete
MAKGKELIYTIRVIDKSKVVIDELGQEVQTLEQAFVEINNELTKTDTLLDGTRASFEKQIRTLKQQRDNLAKSSQAYNEYNIKILAVENDMRKLTTATKNQDQVNADMIANTGLASNTIVEFGRTISDAPFGIIGVTNNLSVMATNFETLSGKMGGTQNAFKLLIRQLKKGGAFVLAIQVALAAVTLFRDEITEFFMGTKKAEKAVVDLKDELVDTNKVLREYIKTLRNVNVELADQLELVNFIRDDYSQLDNAFKDSNATQEQQIAITRNYLVLQSQLSDVNKEINEDLEKLDKKRVKDIKNNELSIRQSKEQVAQNQRRVDALVAAGIKESDSELKLLRNLIRIGEDYQDSLLKENVELGINVELIGKRNELMRLSAKELASVPKDIDEFSDNLFQTLSDAVDKSDVELGKTVMDKLLGTSDKEFQEGFDAIRFVEDSGLDGALNDLNEFIKEYQGENAIEKINLAEQQAKTELGILYDAIEEETGLRIGFNEDLLRIEEFYGEQRAKVSEKENQAKAKSIRVAAQAAVQVGKLLQQLGDENKTVAIAGVVVEKAGAIAKIIANKSIADAAALPLLSNPATFALGTSLMTTNKITAATGVIATTAGAIKAIKEIRNPESASTSATSIAEAPAPVIQAPAFNVVGATQTSQLAQTIAGAEEKPIKAFVVESEITSAQALARSRIFNASI